MKVSELIIALKKLDQESTVMIYHEDDEHSVEIYDIEDVSESNAHAEREDIVGKVKFKFCGPDEGRKFAFINMSTTY